MGYKWKPSKTARRDFAIKMQTDSDFTQQYEKRKLDRAEKRRAGSQFDYQSAGGNYVPTKFQHDKASEFLGTKELTPEQQNACNQVMFGWSCSEKVHHDYIHIVNELIRSN